MIDGLEPHQVECVERVAAILADVCEWFLSLDEDFQRELVQAAALEQERHLARAGAGAGDSTPPAPIQEEP